MIIYGEFAVTRKKTVTTGLPFRTRDTSPSVSNSQAAEIVDHEGYFTHCSNVTAQTHAYLHPAKTLHFVDIRYFKTKRHALIPWHV